MYLKSRLIAVAGMLLIASGAFATTFVVGNDREMVQRADAIVRATVLGSYTQLDSAGAIETVTTVSVQEVIKGRLGSSTIDIHEPGGILNGQARLIAGAPRFRDGDETVLFLNRTPRNTWAVWNLALGKFTFETDNAGQKLLVRAEQDIVGWDSDGSVHHETRRAADRFLSFIRTEANGGVALENYSVAYHPLKLRKQTEAVGIKTFTATSYTIDIAQNGGAGARWNNFPTAHNFLTETNSASTLSPSTATAAALASWNNDTGSNVNYTSSADPCTGGCKTNGITGSADGWNTIQYERSLAVYGVGAFTCPGNGSYSGVLGIGGISATSGSHSGPNSETFFTTSEVDVDMNVGVLNCAALGQSNLNSGVTHEVGHTLGFRHSDQTRLDNPGTACATDATLDCSSNAIMTSTVPNGLAAALQTWDVSAVRAVYPGSVVVTRVRGDFNGDNKSDIYWRNTSTGSNHFWYVNGGTLTGGGDPPTVSTTLAVVGIGDFNGDGKADILWRNTSTGEIFVWFMNGSTLTGGVTLLTVANANVIVAGVGDFNADGFADILWRNTTTGENFIWFCNASGFSSGGQVITVSGAGLSVAGVADFNNDGKADIFWRNSNTGENFIWLMNGATLTTGVQLPSITGQTPYTGDFNGDGTFDILWRNNTSGANAIWYITNGALSGGTLLPTVSTTLSVIGVGDFNGDGTYDLLWRNPTTNENSVWTITNGTLVGGGALPNTSSTLSLQAPKG